MVRTVPTYSAAQVREAEAPLLTAGVPLMRRAAAALAEITREQLADAATARILVLAGGGDNGGDALYAAADLAGAATVDVLPVGTRVHEAALAAALEAGARRIGPDEAEAAASASSVLMDGILGIGAASDPALRGLARDVVERLLPVVRERGPRVIAVDVPSGLHPDTGAADEVVLPATTTVTFGAVKAGLLAGRGPELAGDIVLVDIGLGPALSGVTPVGEGVVSRVVRAPGPHTP